MSKRSIVLAVSLLALAAVVPAGSAIAQPSTQAVATAAQVQAVTAAQVQQAAQKYIEALGPEK